jgi:hypothetical protein
MQRNVFGALPIGFVIFVGSVLQEHPIPASAPAAASTARLRRFAVVDEQGTHSEAYRMLVPSSWKAEGKIQWDIERKSSPTSLGVRARNPDASEAFDVFPQQLFMWSPVLAQVGVGKRYLGCEIAQPLDSPIAALRQIVLPRYRSDLHDVRVTGAEELPKLSQAALPLYEKPGVPAVVRAGRLHLEYSDQGVAMREELTCLFMTSTGPSGTIWGVDGITSFRAPAAVFEARLPLFRAMLFSLEPAPEWFEDVARATRILAEGVKHDQAEVLKRVETERQKNDAIRASIRQDFDARQRAMTRVRENFDSKAGRGVERRVNPFDGIVEDVPNEYPRAWVNGLGEHVFAADPNFDPKVGSNEDWRPMTPKD